MRLHNIDYGYKITHKNHPCRLWIDKSKSNFEWLKELGLCLCKEYTYRYGKVHKSQAIISDTYCPITIPDGKLTPFAQAMPNEYKDKDPVKAYRNYYRHAKQELLIYTKRKPPEWLADIAIYKDA
jgi:hypothetical protein